MREALFVRMARPVIFALTAVLTTPVCSWSASFKQATYLTTIAEPVSDADWAVPCEAGLSPYVMNVQQDLTDFGTIYINPWFLTGSGTVVERRGTVVTSNHPSADGPQTRSSLARKGIVETTSPFIIEGTLRACGFRKQLTVVDTALRVHGALGVWEIDTAISEFSQRENSGKQDVSVKFAALLKGQPPTIPNLIRRDDGPDLVKQNIGYNFDTARIWGVQTLRFSVIDVMASDGTTQTHLKNGMRLSFKILVVDE